MASCCRCQLCQLKKSVTPKIIFRESSARPWLDKSWSFLLGFMRRLSLLPDGSLHLDMLPDDVAGARRQLPYDNRASGIDMHFATLSMASPFVSCGIGALAPVSLSALTTPSASLAMSVRSTYPMLAVQSFCKWPRHQHLMSCIWLYRCSSRPPLMLCP